MTKGDAKAKDKRAVSANNSLKKKKRKKPKDKPKRPLSAYNYFLKDERKKILQALKLEHQNFDTTGDSHDTITAGERSRLLTTNGNVSFEEIGKIIGKRWKSINQQRLYEYKALALGDLDRYKKEMEFYNKSKQERQPYNSIWTSENRQTMNNGIYHMDGSHSIMPAKISDHDNDHFHIDEQSQLRAQNRDFVAHQSHCYNPGPNRFHYQEPGGQQIQAGRYGGMGLPTMMNYVTNSQESQYNSTHDAYQGGCMQTYCSERYCDGVRHPTYYHDEQLLTYKMRPKEGIHNIWAPVGP